MNIIKYAKFILWIGLVFLLAYCFLRSCFNLLGLGEPEINKIERLDDGSFIEADTTRFCNPNQKTFYSVHVKDSAEIVDYKTPCAHCGSKWSYHKTSLEWTEVTMPSPL